MSWSGHDSLITAALHLNDLDLACKAVQEALHIKTGDVAGQVFNGLIHQAWPGMSMEVRKHWLTIYLAAEVANAA